ncbi:cell division protein ZapE [Zafaria sp. Z1313]|uniref:cell division protein ZapE n=1 Tax=unclassified Zafaria TaxID=2828765 RepID=UPI002E77DD32|nr:cell division protein ZapE [Zafaria sp. J156]MEE1621193.1 cell division protein ZapE [Zafaria sp. J156]
MAPRGSAAGTRFPLPWRRLTAAARTRRGIGRAARDHGLVLDPAQLSAAGLLARAAGSLDRPSGPPGHVYLWGPPGRGKTWLADAFFDAVPVQGKRRVHFHAFFRELHGRVHAAGEASRAAERGAGRGAAERRGSAIDEALGTMLAGTRLLCFDEFHCNDPGDAMLLTRLLKRIVEERILLVATSNYAPEQLLPDEYFHHLAEPAIALIRAQMQVVEIAGPTDYRAVRPSTRAAGFSSGTHWPDPVGDGPGTAGLVPPSPAERRILRPTTQDIEALRAADGQLWFRFDALCGAPTAPMDYLRLAEDSRHWVVDSVPPLDRLTPYALRRFGNVVDVLYERDVRLDLIGGGSFEEAGSLIPPADAARLFSRLSALAAPARAAAAGR